MAPIRFKKKCTRCNKNYVEVTLRTRYVVCKDCQEKEMQGEVEDPEIKKMLDIPDEFYEKNYFLRSIKVNAIRYQNLSEKQIAAFKKTVEEMTEAQGTESSGAKRTEGSVVPKIESSSTPEKDTSLSEAKSSETKKD